MTTTQNMIRGRSNVVTLTNKSGGALVAGDVCVIDTTTDEAATTTTSAASVLKVYVSAESIANNAAGKFYSAGFCPLATPSASVTRGRYLFTHTVAKQCAENATYGSGAFGVILKSGTTPSVWLFGTTAQGTGGTFGGTTGSTDNAVLRADGTGGATIQSSLATVDDSGTVNIPTGQTYNINNTPHTHAGGAGAITFLQAVSGGGASYDFASSISGTYDDYLIEFLGIIPQTSTASLLMRMGTGGGPTYDSGNNYGWAVQVFRAAATAVTGAETGASSINLINYGLSTANAAYSMNGSIRLYNPGSGTLVPRILGMVNYFDGTYYPANNVTGVYHSTTAITAFQFLMSSGNIASGTIRVYGVAKS